MPKFEKPQQSGEEKEVPESSQTEQEGAEENINNLYEDTLRNYVQRMKEEKLGRGTTVSEFITGYISELDVDDETKKELEKRVFALGENLTDDAFRFVESEEREEKIANETPSEKNERLVEEAWSVDGLKKSIVDIGSVKDAKNEYHPTELFQAIDRVMEGEASPDELPAKYGLREKVIEMRNKNFDREIEKAGDFTELFGVLKKMINSGKLPFGRHKLFGMIGTLRKGERIEEDYEEYQQVPLHIRRKVEELLKEPTPKRKQPEQVYRTSRGDVRGRVVNSRPGGGPHVIETSKGKVKVDDAHSIK